MSGHSEAQLSLGLNSNGAFKYALFDEYIVTVRQTTRAWVYPAAAVRICAMHPLERGETAKPAKTKKNHGPHFLPCSMARALSMLPMKKPKGKHET